MASRVWIEDDPEDFTLEGFSLRSTNSVPPAYTKMDPPQKRTSEIWFSFAVIAVPLVSLSAMLLGIVLYFRVQRSTSSSFTTEEDEPGVYYVRISATTLVLLASFSSSVAPTLIGFLMTLVRYPISQHIVRHSEMENLEELPTPYQLGLLITLFESGIGAIWPWIKYMASAWYTKRKTVHAVTASVIALMTAIYMMYLLSIR
jgi:hypothetical protein